MLVLAALMGVLIGATLGALGGGGSILTVPALVYVLGQDAHGAVIGSLVVVAAAATAGALSHLRTGRVRVREGLVFGALGIAGSVLGSRLSAGISQSGLLAGFSVLMLVAAGAMVLRVGRARAPVAAGAGPSRAGAPGRGVPPAGAGGGARRRGVPVMVLTATGVGLLTGFFGVGGGFVVVPALVLVMGFDMAAAVATSLVVIAVNSGAALAARIGTPAHVDWAVVGVFAAAAIGASVLGSKATGLVPPRQSARAFSVLLVAVAIYTLVRSLSHV